jgi:hypothetical protein
VAGDDNEEVADRVQTLECVNLKKRVTTDLDAIIPLADVRRPTSAALPLKLSHDGFEKLTSKRKIRAWASPTSKSATWKPFSVFLVAIAAQQSKSFTTAASHVQFGGRRGCKRYEADA